MSRRFYTVVIVASCTQTYTYVITELQKELLFNSTTLSLWKT